MALLRALADEIVSALEYISSAGPRSLFGAQRTMKARTGQALLEPRPAVQKVLEIVKSVDVSEVFRSVRELDAYLDTMQKRVRAGEAGE